MFEQVRVSHEYPSKSQFFMDQSLDKSPLMLKNLRFPYVFPAHVPMFPAPAAAPDVMSHLLPTYSASVGTAMAPKVLGSADLDFGASGWRSRRSLGIPRVVFFCLENYTLW